MKKILMVALAAAFLSCGTKVRETIQVPNIDAVVALYLYISIARLDVYMCEARREPAREAAFLDAAQQDVHRLREELGAYDENGRVGPYCGSVCQEMINFLAMAGRAGLLPCEEQTKEETMAEEKKVELKSKPKPKCPKCGEEAECYSEDVGLGQDFLDKYTLVCECGYVAYETRSGGQKDQPSEEATLCPFCGTNCYAHEPPPKAARTS